jgi:hypothetical protein
MARIVPEASHLGEAAMNHQWRTTRRLVPHPDARRRWDRAYQLLLGWAASGPEPAGDPIPATIAAEATDESCDLWTSPPMAGAGLEA